MSGPPTSDLVLDADGDPMRRRILELLHAGEMPVGELADRLPILRPAVSKHLRILGEAGLVRHRSKGTRNLYAIDPAGIRAARSWFDSLWDEALTSFAAYAETVASRERES